jgi:hypothetical protein
MSTVSSSAGNANAVGAVVSEHAQVASTERSVDTTIVGVADEI